MKFVHQGPHEHGRLGAPFPFQSNMPTLELGAGARLWDLFIKVRVDRRVPPFLPLKLTARNSISTGV